MKLSRADDERIERAIAGRLPDDELIQLQRDLVHDAGLRAAYVDRVWLDASLQADREQLRPLLDEAAPAGWSGSRWPLFVGFGALAAAAGLAVVVGVQQVRSDARLRPVATLVQAHNAKWSGSTLPTVEQAALVRGTLALAEGIVTLKFASGATVTLEAPSKLELVSAMNCRLLEGSLTADVPPAASGFTVDTADLRVVDVGTRFGVTAGSAGNSHVFVFEGEVVLNQPGGAEIRRLNAGKSFHVASGSTAAMFEPARFQAPQHIDGWTSITTSYGRGQDAYVRRGNNATRPGTQPLLMVKHSDLEASRTNERRAVLTFDLTDIRPREIEEAQLLLDPEPSGMGFSAMVPDSRFAVYGVRDGSPGESWSEERITWETLPASTDTGLVAGEVVRLGEFWIPRGGSGEPVTLRGDALRDFIRDDRNGLATFLIVRETTETHSSGLVHAFASKEHPTGRPPTLRTR